MASHFLLPWSLTYNHSAAFNWYIKTRKSSIQSPTTSLVKIRAWHDVRGLTYQKPHVADEGHYSGGFWIQFDSLRFFKHALTPHST